MKLKINKKAEDKIRVLIHKYPQLEWSGYALIKVGDKISDGLILKDIYPVSLGSYSYTIFKDTQELRQKVMDYAIENNLYEKDEFDDIIPKSCYLQRIHSHHRMGAFHSGEDDNDIKASKNKEEDPYNDFYVSLVVDTLRDYKCKGFYKIKVPKEINSISVATGETVKVKFKEKVIYNDFEIDNFEFEEDCLENKDITDENFEEISKQVFGNKQDFFFNLIKENEYKPKITRTNYFNNVNVNIIYSKSSYPKYDYSDYYDDNDDYDSYDNYGYGYNYQNSNYNHKEEKIRNDIKDIFIGIVKEEDYVVYMDEFLNCLRYVSAKKNFAGILIKKLKEFNCMHIIKELIKKMKK